MTYILFLPLTGVLSSAACSIHLLWSFLSHHCFLSFIGSLSRRMLTLSLRCAIQSLARRAPTKNRWKLAFFTTYRTSCSSWKNVIAHLFFFLETPCTLFISYTYHDVSTQIIIRLFQILEFKIIPLCWHQ